MSACIEWSGAIGEDGYGKVSLSAALRAYHGVKRTQRAHRLAFCEGRVLPLWSIRGQLVMHTCDNRRCCNHNHLRLGSPADNSADMISKGRQAKGRHAARPKFTEAEVLEIRNEYALKQITQAALAAKYRASQSLVSLIVNRKCWGWL